MSTPWRAMALTLVATLLASGSVSANKYPCDQPDLGPFNHRHPSLAGSFGATGTWWFPVARQPGDAPRCEWSSESPLDPLQRWRLECDWNFVACESGSCPSGWTTPFTPITPLPDSDANAATISLQLEDVALESYNHEHQRADLLRLWIDTVPPEFWIGYGVLRVRYPDGRWSLAVPASGGWPWSSRCCHGWSPASAVSCSSSSTVTIACWPSRRSRSPTS